MDEEWLRITLAHILTRLGAIEEKLSHLNFPQGLGHGGVQYQAVIPETNEPVEENMKRWKEGRPFTFEEKK
jgi:hypothetical protein